MTGAHSASLFGAALLAAAAICSGAAAAPRTADEKLLQLMQRAQPQTPPSQNAVATTSPERLKERADLIKSGEAALARMDATAAIDYLDRAALILHAADTEMTLVRAYMQNGQYRRALAFGAHTAGAHLDVIGGSALYAWLLHAGGQVGIAQRLLSEADARMPDDPMLARVQAQLKSGAPLAGGDLLALPTRLAPYGSSRGLPPSARVLGSGLLIDGGKQALVPLTLLPRSGKFWVRNGLGQLSRATLQKRLPQIGLAWVRLESPLPAPEGLWMAPADAFPGSVGYAVEFVASRNSTPAWPVMRTGFLGAAIGNGGDRLLGIDMPGGPRGGPVFDAAGRLTGMALPGPLEKTSKSPTPDRFIPVSLIQAQLKPSGQAATMLGNSPPADLPPRAAADRIYEISLKASVQLIGVIGLP